MHWKSGALGLRQGLVYFRTFLAGRVAGGVQHLQKGGMWGGRWDRGWRPGVRLHRWAVLKNYCLTPEHG
jgi:hypothetical protein